MTRGEARLRRFAVVGGAGSHDDSHVVASIDLSATSLPEVIKLALDSALHYPIAAHFRSV